jgi:hypothetical protein
MTNIRSAATGRSMPIGSHLQIHRINVAEGLGIAQAQLDGGWIKG